MRADAPHPAAAAPAVPSERGPRFSMPRRQWGGEVAEDGQPARPGLRLLRNESGPRPGGVERSISSPCEHPGRAGDVGQPSVTALGPPRDHGVWACSAEHRLESTMAPFVAEHTFD
jgi:hypothetical protein